MFERFTERARQVIVLAQAYARELNHSYIGTEHILMGIVREEEGLGCRSLKNLGIIEMNVEDTLVQHVAPGTEPGEGGQLPFTPYAKKVLEHALREALSLGHNFIGTEHILLGLIRGDEGTATKVLNDLGVDPEMIRTEVIRMLSGPSKRTVAVPAVKPAEPQDVEAAIKAISESMKAIEGRVHEIHIATQLQRVEDKLDRLLAIVDPPQGDQDAAA